MGILDILRLIFSRYSYFLHTVPLSVYVFYVIFRNVDNYIINSLIKTGLLAIGIGAITSFIACVMGIPLKSLISFNWYYYGPLHWGIFFLSYYYILLKRKEESKLASFTLATLAAAGGGWLYEVPSWHPISMFLGKGSFFYNNFQIMCILLLLFELRKKRFNPNPLIYAILLSSMFLGWKEFPFPNSQIICLILLGYELLRRGFKPNRFIIIMFLIFIAFSIPLILDKNALLNFCRETLLSLNVNWTYSYAQKVKWVYRIPASLFLLSLLNGINKQREMTK